MTVRCQGGIPRGDSAPLVTPPSIKNRNQENNESKHLQEPLLEWSRKSKCFDDGDQHDLRANRDGG